MKKTIRYFDLEDCKSKKISMQEVEYLPPKECDLEKAKSFIYLKTSYKELINLLTERDFDYDSRPKKYPIDLTNEQLFNIQMPNYTLTLEDFKIIIKNLFL